MAGVNLEAHQGVVQLALEEDHQVVAQRDEGEDQGERQVVVLLVWGGVVALLVLVLLLVLVRELVLEPLLALELELYDWRHQVV